MKNSNNILTHTQIYPEDEEFTNELKLNNIIEVVGFIDGYTIDIDNTEFADSMITDPNPDVPVLCIHTVQFKLFPDLYEKSIEMSELNLFKLF